MRFTDDQLSCGAGACRARVPREEGALAPGLLDELRGRLRPFFQTSGRRARNYASPARQWEQTDTSMHTTRINPSSDIRPARGSHPVDHPARPLRSTPSPAIPVLPRGWAPLTPDQQRAVLEACDAAPDGMVFMIPSMCEVDAEYRVYRLENESWARLWVAAECRTDCDGVVFNRVLLGLGSDAAVVVRIALDAVNRELALRGESWRLGVNPPAVPALDPHRI